MSRTLKQHRSLPEMGMILFGADLRLESEMTGNFYWTPEAQAGLQPEFCLDVVDLGNDYSLEEGS